MPRRIFIRDGGLTASKPIPNGYTAIGSDGGMPKKQILSTISDLGGGTSLERFDVISMGFSQGFTAAYEYEIPKFMNWNKNGRYLLWEILDSSGNSLDKDLDYSEDTSSEANLIPKIVSRCLSNNISLKGYYYKNQSKEKFRIVGRNYAYWALVGLNNYGRMNRNSYGNRLFTIQPSTSGDNLLQSMNNDLGIGLSGQGLWWTTNKKLYLPNLSSTFYNGNLLGERSYEYAISSTGDYVLKIDAGIFSEYKPANPPEASVYSVNRNGSVNSYPGSYPSFGDEGSKILLNSIKFETSSYNSGSYLKSYIVRPYGLDTFLLSNNSIISGSDEVFLISEPVRGTSVICSIPIRNQLDNLNFGDDLSVNDNKTRKNRWGSIWLEDIPSIRNMSKDNLARSIQKSSRAESFSVKWRVAYGNKGIYTISDDYILVRGDGKNLIGFVNDNK